MDRVDRSVRFDRNELPPFIPQVIKFLTTAAGLLCYARSPREARKSAERIRLMSLSARVGILLLVTSLILPVAGAESFKSARLIPTATAVAFIQTADLNGDGHADIVYLSSNLSSGPHLLLGKGDGT